MSIPQGLLDAFENAQHTIFRLETLQHYAGDPEDELGEAKQHWCDLVRRRVADGVTMQRVHLVKYPLTDYMRFEMAWSYPPNIAAGEEVRIALDGDWSTDFWMFDDREVWVMHYNPAGDLLYAEQVTRPQAVQSAVQIKREALDGSTPLVTHAAVS